MSSKEKSEELLIPKEVYLSHGVRIGAYVKTKTMEKFIYKVRSDGLCILDLKKTDERIRIAAKMIARYEPSKVVVVCARPYGIKSVQMFCKFTGTIPITGRFLPGTFTNPSLPTYIEPDLLVATDPRIDRQAINEAAAMGIPVIALCSTDSYCSYVDLIIPVNNKGRKSLALVYWLLARQVLRERGELGPNEDLPVPPEAFEVKVERISIPRRVA